MTRAGLLLVTGLLIGCAGQPLTAHELPGAGRRAPRRLAPHVQGQLIVKFTQEAADAVEQARRMDTPTHTGIESLDQVFTEYGVFKIERVFPDRPAPMTDTTGMNRVFLLHLSAEQGLEAVARSFEEHPMVEYAEPNYLAHINPDLS